MTTDNGPRWVHDCQACGVRLQEGEVCPLHAPATITPEEQARRDRVTAAITKFQSKPAPPPRRWRR